MIVIHFSLINVHSCLNHFIFSLFPSRHVRLNGLVRCIPLIINNLVLFGSYCSFPILYIKLVIEQVSIYSIQMIEVLIIAFRK